MLGLAGLQLTDGPAHSELVFDAETGVATLVEINARFHNANVRPLLDACGAAPNAIAVAAMACLPDGDEWAAVPSDPAPTATGVLVHLVSRASGALDAVDEGALAALEGLPTLVDLELYRTEPGAPVVATVDIKTDAGWVLLAGAAADVEADYAAVQDLQARLFRVVPGS